MNTGTQFHILAMKTSANEKVIVEFVSYSHAYMWLDSTHRVKPESEPRLEMQKEETSH